MELNVLSILVGVMGCVGAVVLIWYVVGWSMNLSRYDRPKYLPRDDEALWAKIMASSRRAWYYKSISTDSMSFDNWDLGILSTNPSKLHKTYGLTPRVTDVILVPKKWGGHWVVVITRPLKRNRFITTYIGEFIDGKIHRNRSRENSINIS